MLIAQKSTTVVSKNMPLLTTFLVKVLSHLGDKFLFLPEMINMETNVRVAERGFTPVLSEAAFPRSKDGVISQISKRQGHGLKGYPSLSG